MTNINSNFSYYNRNIGFGTSTPLRSNSIETQIQPNLSNIGVEVPVNPNISSNMPSFGLTLKKNNIEQKEDKSNNGKLDLSEVGKNFVKGLAGFAIETIKHPIRSLGIAVGMGALTALCPPLAGIMIGGAAFAGLFSFGGGVIKAVASASKKDWDGFEKSFESTGSGISSMLMSAFMARGYSKLKGVNLEKFQFSKQGITNWIKDSYKLVKKESVDGYRSAWNLGKANIKAAINTFANRKTDGFKLINFIKSRKTALSNINNSPNLNDAGKPTALVDKIRYFMAKDKNKFIGEFAERGAIDRTYLKTSNHILAEIPTALKQSWAYLPEHDKTAQRNLDANALNLEM